MNSIKNPSNVLDPDLFLNDIANIQIYIGFIGQLLTKKLYNEKYNIYKRILKEMNKLIVILLTDLQATTVNRATKATSSKLNEVSSVSRSKVKKIGYI